MKYNCVLKSESKENIYFSGENKYVTSLNIKLYLTSIAKAEPSISSYLMNKDFYVKIKIGDQHTFNREIKYYDLLDKYNITPKL